MTVAAALYQPGDLLLFHGTSWISRAIRWATRGRYEAPTYANHVGGVGQGGNNAFQATCIEALWTVRERPLHEAMAGGQLQVWRMRDISEGERYELAVHARRYLGRKYGPLKILAHLGDALLGKVFGGNPYVFRRLARLDDYPICSWVWARAYEKSIGYRFGVEARAATPDDMHDWVRAHPEQWERVA